MAAPRTGPTPYDIKRMPVPMRADGSIAPMSNPMFKGDPPYTGAWKDAAYDPETPGPLHHPGVLPSPGGDAALAPTALATL